ncbi:Uma2 family endonuclease [soil metagenome]
MNVAEHTTLGKAVRPRRFSVDEFLQMTEAGILPEESGWEVIDGILVDKVTIGSKHASVVRRFTAFLYGVLGDRFTVAVQGPIHIDDYNEPEPDIAILKYRADFYAEAHPSPADTLLVVEVSDSSASLDREVKLGLYAEAGIPEVWLVDLKADAVERHTSPDNGRYHSIEINERGGSVASTAVEGLTVEVTDILG